MTIREIQFKPVTATMIQSDDVDGTYQISRTPKPEAGKHTYRAWHRPTSKVIWTESVYDEPAERAAALEACKEMCRRHAGHV